MEIKEPIKYSSGTHWSYGLGGFLDNFLLTAFSVRVISYYETEIFLPILLVGIAFFIYGVWNMVNDTIAGYLSDRIYSFTRKWGRRFPWFISSAIPCAVLYVLIFIVPFSSEILIFIWLVLLICAFDFLYSLWNINWLALFPDKFRSQKERTKVAGLISIWGNLGIALGMIIPPLFIEYGQRETYITTAVILAVITIINVVLMIPGMKEDEKLREKSFLIMESAENKDNIFKIMKKALKNKNCIAYLFVYLAQLVLMMLMLASLSYFVRYVLKMEAMVEIYISAMFLLGSIISFVGKSE